MQETQNFHSRSEWRRATCSTACCSVADLRDIHDPVRGGDGVRRREEDERRFGRDDDEAEANYSTCGVVEADLELFWNSWSVGFLGERL